MGTFDGNVSSFSIEETLNANNNKVVRQSNFDVKNYLNTKLEDGETERTVKIRILPVSSEDGNFRIAVKTHNLKVNRKVAATGFKSFLCINDPQVPDYNPSEKCPICEKAQFYFNEAKKYRETDPVKSNAIFKKACSLQPKTTYIVRVIERGKENEGVKFWRFNENSKGKGIYDALIALYKQRKEDMADAGVENYNIFDLDNGRDIVLNLKKTMRQDGVEEVAIQVNDQSVNKPLTTDIEQGNAWVNDVKRWYNAYAVKSKEYLEIIAEDQIPYFDRNQNKWVGKTEEDFLNAQKKKEETKAELDAVDEVLKENTLSDTQSAVSDDYDLPF